MTTSHSTLNLSLKRSKRSMMTTPNRSKTVEATRARFKEWKVLADWAVTKDCRRMQNPKDTTPMMSKDLQKISCKLCRRRRMTLVIWALSHRRQMRNLWLQPSNPSMCRLISWPWSKLVQNHSWTPKKCLNRNPLRFKSIQNMEQIWEKARFDYFVITSKPDSIIIFKLIKYMVWH